MVDNLDPGSNKQFLFGENEHILQKRLEILFPVYINKYIRVQCVHVLRQICGYYENNGRVK